MSPDPEQLSLDVGPGAPAPAGAVGARAVALAEPLPPAPHPPTAEQAAAIDSRDRDVFLEAGAGTGKTRVLVERYCDAVDLDGVAPERILAFTFTEKAAAEMRRRVRLELLRRAAEPDGDLERAERLRRAARAGEAAPITTIHGFCRRLLASHPIAAGLDPGFRVLDADEAARLGALAFDDALAELAAQDDAVAAIAAAYRNRRLRSLIRAAYADLRNHGHRSPDLPPLQISAFEGSDAAETVPDPEELELAQASYGAIRALLVAFGARFEEVKRQRSGVDFDDLQLLSLELLRGSPAVRAAQRERFDHLLVDEFQDTSPLQIGLVRELRGPETRLFTVGDEFQSIYAFRGADLASFRAQREASPAVLRLSGSFRSTPPVVAAVNAVGDILLEGFNHLRVGREPQAGAPGLVPGGDPAVELLLTKYEGWGADCPPISTAAVETGADRVAEARFLARRLRELVDAGEAEAGGTVVLLRAFSHIDAYVEALERAGLDPYVVGGRGYWSSQQVEDALKLLACVANPLDDEALFAALASPAAAASPDALWLLRRAAGRGRHVWPTLRAVLVDEAEDADASAVETLRLLGAEDRGALASFGRRLLALREQAPQLPLDSLTERTLEAFDYDLAALSMRDGRRRAANLLKLVRLAGEFEANEGRDLRGFLDGVATRAALSDREAEAATAAEDHDGVTVMTIHAAKGLEFDTVAVADLSRGHRVAAAGSDMPVSFATDPEREGADEAEGRDPDEPAPPRVGLRLARAGASTLTVEGYKGIADAAAEAEAEETGRLVYVAASRARRRLLLSGTFKEKEANGEPREHKTGDSTIWRLLQGFELADDGETTQLDLPIERALPREDLEAEFSVPSIRVRFNRPTEPGIAERLGADLREARPDPGPPPGGTPPMTVLAERGASAARSLSYAALSEYSRCGYRFLIERVVGLGGGMAAAPGAGGGGTGGDESRARLGFGRAVHELLETAALREWEQPAAGEVEAALLRQGAPAARAGEAAEMLGAWLGSALLGELRAAGARFRPELGFRLELGSGALVRGTVDLLAEVDGEPPLLVDYKTDARPPAPGSSLPPEYGIQRSLYARAVASSLGVDRVRTAYVFLRSPGAPIAEELDEGGIAAAGEAVAALVERIEAGDFAPTPAPHRALCHDCPARRRLCPHPPELTGAEAPPVAV